MREETFVTEAEAKLSDFKDPVSGARACVLFHLFLSLFLLVWCLRLSLVVDRCVYINVHTPTPPPGVPLKKMEETSYFFRMSKYKQRLVEHIKGSPNFILPDTRRNLILGA